MILAASDDHAPKGPWPALVTMLGFKVVTEAASDAGSNLSQLDAEAQFSHPDVTHEKGALASGVHHGTELRGKPVCCCAAE